MQQRPSDATPRGRLSSVPCGSKLPNGKAAAGLALAILSLAIHSGAAQQGFGLPPIQSREAGRHEVNPAFQLHANRSPARPGGDESRGVPKTFVDMTAAELVLAVPELKHLEPVESQDVLPQILQRAGAAVAAFFDNFPNTTCTEHVTSMVDDAYGAGTFHYAGAFHYDAKYNYLALAQARALKGRIKEYRTDDKGALVEPDAKTSVVTVGFVAMSEHFHPEFQPDSRFRYLGREVMEKQDTYVVAFAQRPAVARRVTSIQFLGQSEIAFWQGVAWIDPASFRILRLRTDIQPPPGHVGVLKETTQILYSEVSFKQGNKTLWLPREVTVTGQLSQYLFRNQHRYSDYQIFSVEVEQKHDNP